MRVLIFSDNHGSLKELDHVLSHFKFDRVFGLGDFEVSEYELNERGVSGVRGNSYFDPNYLIDRVCEISGYNFLFTHGHTHSVRGSLLSLTLFAKENNIDITFYGHTHVARIDEEDNRYFINPGSISKPYYPSYSTCAIMDIIGKNIIIKIIDAITFKVFKEITITK